MQPAAEEVLTGGNVSAGVVRVGSTVRKPAGPATPAVQALLEHLAAAVRRGPRRPLGPAAAYLETNCPVWTAALLD